MEFLLISIVASIAIVSVSIVTLKTVKLILSDDINLAKKVKFLKNENI